MTGFGTPEPTKKVDDFFKPASEKKRKAFLTLLYGDGGVGKTFTAMTFPSPILYIDTEDRAEECRYYNFPDKDIKIFEVRKIKLDGSMNDAIDCYGTIENLTEVVIALAKEVEQGRQVGTVVMDSCTDVWRDCLDWAGNEFAKRVSKDGVRLADPLTLKLTNQFDYSVPTKKYLHLLFALRTLLNHGTYVVLTAREDDVPAYQLEKEKKEGKQRKETDLIRAQKDTLFMAEVAFNLRKARDEKGEHYRAVCIKRLGLPVKGIEVDELNFEKILLMQKEAEAARRKTTFTQKEIDEAVKEMDVPSSIAAGNSVKKLEKKLF